MVVFRKTKKGVVSREEERVEDRYVQFVPPSEVDARLDQVSDDLDKGYLSAVAKICNGLALYRRRGS